MPLEDILKRINEKASVLEEEILSSAKAEAESRIKAARDKARETETEVLSEAVAQAKQIHSIAASRREMQKKQMILRAKQELISQVLNEAEEKLTDLPGQEYRALLLDLIVHKADGSEHLILNETDKDRLGNDFAYQVNSELKKQGKKGNLKLSYSSTLSGGGFILKKGRVSDNVTFPAILRLIREDLEIDLAKVLFKEPSEKENLL